MLVGNTDWTWAVKVFVQKTGIEEDLVVDLAAVQKTEIEKDFGAGLTADQMLETLHNQAAAQKILPAETVVADP